MIKKNILFVLFFILTSCGFSPIHINQNYLNYDLKIINIKGDIEINNIIKSKLTTKKSKAQSGQKELFEIEIDTDYQRRIFSKNLAGTADNYQLNVLAKVSITNNNIKKDYIFKETFLMKNINDQFEQTQYEKNIKNNFANSISEKIISKIQLE